MSFSLAEEENGTTSTEPYTRRRYTRLETNEALKLLCLPSSNFISKIPNRPAGGEIYLFQPRLRLYFDNWRTDGYRWSNRGTSTMSLNRRPALRKSFFYLMTKEGQKNNFQKHVYRLLDSDQKVVIHYIGDEKLCTDSSVVPARKKSRHSSHLVRSFLSLPEIPSKKKEVSEKNNRHLTKKVFETKSASNKVYPPQSMHRSYPQNSQRCRSNSFKHKSIKFFLLPWDDIQLRTIWVRLAGYDPFDANDVKHITRLHSVCSLHFVDKHSDLLHSSFPTLKLPIQGSNEYDKILETASEVCSSLQYPVVKSEVSNPVHQQTSSSYSLNNSSDVEPRRQNVPPSASKAITSSSNTDQIYSPPVKVPKKQTFPKQFTSLGQIHSIEKPTAASSNINTTQSQPIDCSSNLSKFQSFPSKPLQPHTAVLRSETQVRTSPPIDILHQKEKRLLAVPNHQSSVMSNMSSLWKAGRLCDACISNGTVRIMVHKIIFGAVCPKVLPVFYSTINSDLPSITFPSTVSEEALLAFCEYIYDGVLELDKNILSQLKIIARCLDMQDFDKLCNNQLKLAENSATISADTVESSLTEPCSSSGLISDINTQIPCQDNFSQSIPSKLITLYNRNFEGNSSLLSQKRQLKRKPVKLEICNTNQNDQNNSEDTRNQPEIKVELIGPDDYLYGYQNLTSTHQGLDLSDSDLTESNLISHNASVDKFQHNSDLQPTEQSLLSSSLSSSHFSVHSKSHPVGYLTPTSIRRLVSCEEFQHPKSSENSKPYPISLFPVNDEPLSSSNLQLAYLKKKHNAR